MTVQFVCVFLSVVHTARIMPHYTRKRTPYILQEALLTNAALLEQLI